MSKSEVLTTIEARHEVGKEVTIRLTIAQPETEEPTMRLVMELEPMLVMLIDLVTDLQALREPDRIYRGPSLN